MDHAHRGPLTGLIFWVAIAFSAYQLIAAAFHPFSSQVIRTLHVGFVLLLIFVLYPPFGKHEGPGKWLGWALGLTGFSFGFYHWVFESDLTARAGEMVGFDWLIATVTVALVYDAARRVMGWGQPIICLML